MKTFALNAALGLAALLAVAGHASAATYDFRYAFAGDGAPNVVTGSFTGTGPIDDITNIANISMSLNGAALTGPFYAWSYTPTSLNCGDVSCYSLGGAVVSADSSASNFVFSSAADSAHLGASNYFYVIQPWVNPGATVADQFAYGGSPNSYINYYNGQFDAANFSLTAVPEPSAWAMMVLGLGGIGGALRMARRKTGAAIAAA